MSFRWLFGVSIGKKEFDYAEKLCKQCKSYKLDHEGSGEVSALSFSEVSHLDDAMEAWNAAWPAFHRLNMLFRAFLFSTDDAKFEGHIYELVDDGRKAQPRRSMLYAASGPATLFDPLPDAEWLIALEQIEREISPRMASLLNEDEAVSCVIGKLSKGDYKEYYIAYEIICRSMRLHVKNHKELSRKAGISEDQIKIFYRTAHDLHRHDPVRPTLGNTMDATEAKVFSSSSLWHG